MEAKSGFTTALVKALEKEQAPQDAYREALRALVGSPVAGEVLSEITRLRDVDALKDAITSWATSWTTASHRANVGADARQRFGYLVDVWRNETAFYASVKERAIHWSYQQIIGMGPTVLPLILQELRAEDDDWFWALTAITGEDVARGAETLTEAKTRWLEWADQHAVIRGVLA